MYTNTGYNIHGAFPLLFISPWWFPFAPFINLPPLTWNPPCCDRIRPPRSPVACKLTSPFPTLSSALPLPNSQNPGYQAPFQKERQNVVFINFTKKSVPGRIWPVAGDKEGTRSKCYYASYVFLWRRHIAFSSNLFQYSWATLHYID